MLPARQQQACGCLHMSTLSTLGILAASAIALKLVLPTLRRWLSGPSALPYSASFMMRFAGWMSYLLWQSRLFPSMEKKTSLELINCLKSTRAKDFFPLRDAYVALDALPTVDKGKRALQLSSVFDVFAQRVFLKKSPYTHPKQTPPFFIPGVPAHPYYDSREFPFTQALEAAYPDIRQELENVLATQASRFRSYVGGHGHVEPGWNNLFFYLFGEKNEANAALCPKTMAFLDSIPHLEKTMAMFACLNPHSGLPPHTAPANGILRIHLPLIVPKNCRLTVAGEERCWEEGKVLVFDDSFVHEVRNDSDDIRVVLFFSIYHPCFAPEEVPLLRQFSDAWQALPVTQLYENFQHRQRPSGLVLPAEPGRSVSA
jgi:aspartyl/asparaginyl beta-hydroxylase (cupin superfamily)